MVLVLPIVTHIHVGSDDDAADDDADDVYDGLHLLATRGGAACSPR